MRRRLKQSKTRLREAEGHLLQRQVMARVATAMMEISKRNVRRRRLGRSFRRKY